METRWILNILSICFSCLNLLFLLINFCICFISVFTCHLCSDWLWWDCVISVWWIILNRCVKCYLEINLLLLCFLTYSVLFTYSLCDILQITFTALYLKIFWTRLHCTSLSSEFWCPFQTCSIILQIFIYLCKW